MEVAFFSGPYVCFFVCLVCISAPARAAVKQYQFNVRKKDTKHQQLDMNIASITSLGKPFSSFKFKWRTWAGCATASTTVYVGEGDRVVINVANQAQYNMSIHWWVTSSFTLCFCVENVWKMKNIIAEDYKDWDSIQDHALLPPPKDLPPCWFQSKTTILARIW